jgi:hypothetical protein
MAVNRPKTTVGIIVQGKENPDKSTRDRVAVTGNNKFLQATHFFD